MGWPAWGQDEDWGRYQFGLIFEVKGKMRLEASIPPEWKEEPHSTPPLERRYGLWGGAICPICKRPFRLCLFSPHLLVRILARCPYCGRLVLVRRASVKELRRAEAAEQDAKGATAPVPEERQEEESRRESAQPQDRET